MFFNRQPKESPDELANRLQKEGRFDQLEKELERYNPRKLAPRDRESFYHLRGIVAFQSGDRLTAFMRFKEGLDHCPDSAMLSFSLGQEHEHLRQTDQMFSCFDAFEFPRAPSQYVLAAARYAYLWGRPEKGTRYLEPIAEAYFQLGIADDHFVYVRGLPFFEQTWSYLVAFAWMQSSYDSTDDLLSRAKARLSDYDFDELERFYAGHKRSDYTEYSLKLEADIKSRDPVFPTGYSRTQLAALHAVQNENSSSALAGLNSVVLADNDFPWLPDIALVHRARHYWKAGDTNQETRSRSEFLTKQRLLFEPNHAYNFAFLDYQELLRPIYQGASK